MGHASGKLVVGAVFWEDGGLSHATVLRMARRLMDGRVFWKE
jgi:2-methylaconitate cis-trans-isomerase PrpF